MESDTGSTDAWEMRVQTLLDDPIVHQIMAYDGITSADVLAAFRAIARERHAGEP